LQQNPSTGAWELLGPTALAGTAFGGLLCEHLPGIAPQPTPIRGQQNLAYSSVLQTQTVLSGSTAAWTADCASQPLGFFSLGGRTGCARAQSGLTFVPRSAYADLDPWSSPSLQIGGTAAALGAVQLEAGKSYRVSLGITHAAGCTSSASGSVCPELVVRVGAQEVLRSTLQVAAGQTALIASSFSAASAGSQVVTISAPSGAFELGQLEIVPNASLNSFDSAYERTEAALTVPSVDRKKTLPMRFVGDGAQGFRALLNAGERLLLVKQALALQGTFSVGFTSPFAGSMTCGLVDNLGSVLTSAACSAGMNTVFSYVGSAPAAAVFIDGALSAGVELDNLAVSIDPLVISHCSNGVIDGGETDVDCGGSCSQHCALGKVCSAGTDCASNLCAAGKCVAAPTCTDGMKNGTETDVDCGGSCSQHCALGKVCGVGTDCASNLCTAGKCVAASGPSVAANLSLSSIWDVGYCAAVTVTNKSALTISSWTTVVNLAQSAVSSTWSSAASTSGGQLTAHSLSWNGQLAPNASTSFGYCASKTGSSWQPSIVSASSP